MVLHWRVYGKGDLYSRWKHVHACLSVYVWQERSSPTFCNYFSQQIPINPNTQTCKHDDVWKLHKEQSDPPGILSCHQYPFDWLLTFLCGRWHLLTTHHRELQYYFVYTSRWSATKGYFLGVFSRTVSNSHPYGIVANIAEKIPYGTYFNKWTPVRDSQTNHFLNTKKQSSAILKKILLTKSTMLFQMRKSAQRITLMQRT